jgi:1-acyl-sn-glycerol-3-phosphate acyltransferase
MRLALETRTPIVPVAVIGAEEQSIALFDFKAAARLLGMPALPVTLTGVPLPLPVKYHLHFGQPLQFSGNPDDEDSELERRVREVKAQIQAMINRGLEERQGVFF